MVCGCLSHRFKADEHRCTFTCQECGGEADHKTDPLWQEDWKGVRGYDLVRSGWGPSLHWHSERKSSVGTQRPEDPTDKTTNRPRTVRRHHPLSYRSR